MEGTEKHEQIKHYYSEVLKSTADLQANACCTDPSAVPSDKKKELLSNIEDEILSRFYGCGTPIPDVLEGCTVLDLGCGTGRDVYLLSQLVGEHGEVIGVDMTESQLEVARHFQASQMKRFGFSRTNVRFINAYIEDLSEVASNSVDVVVSNCVVNLSPEKTMVLAEIFRVLKPGGELYFSDVFANRRVPKELMDDPVLHGECLSGAMYTEDFRRLLVRVGCPDYRVVFSSPIELKRNEIVSRLGAVRFQSQTIRAFKLSSLEDRCEDYGQSATYLGTLEDYPYEFRLDNRHVFEKGRPLLVCGNTAAMLAETRYAPHFEVRGDRTTHFGLFDCATPSVDSGGVCC